MSPYRELELDVRERDKRRAYLEQHVFELLIAVLAALSAIAFFVQPDELARTPVGHALHPFDTGWNALYLGGAILTTAGLVAPSHRLEAAGLLFLSSAIAGAGVAIALERGVVGASSIAIYLAAGAACIVRLGTIRRLNRAIVEVDVELERRFARRRGDR